MKVALLALAATLALAGCHASKESSNAGTPAGTTSSASTDGAIEKSRNAMLDKSMNVQDEHWVTSPATTATSAAPASAASAAPAVGADGA